MVLTGLDASGQLRKSDDRDIQLTCQTLQRSGDLGDLLLAVISVSERILRLHELKIGDHDDVAPLLRLEAAALGADLRDGDARRIIDEERRIHEDAGRRGELVPLLLRGDPPGAELRAVDERGRAEQSLHELLA